MKKEKWVLAAAAGVSIVAVAYKFLSKDIPSGAEAVHPFDKNRYLGKWYEIARLPNRIEKNIKDLTEDYSLNEDGTMKVVTKGYNFKKEKWTEATGNIKFNGAEDTGMLQVSYFGPFYAAYNVLDVDDNYQYALVSSSGLGYLWILSRKKTIPNGIRNSFLAKARAIGFAVDELEWV